MHADPVLPVLLGLITIILFSKIGAIIAHRLSLPEVLGELVAGIFIGNLVLLNCTVFEFIRHDHVIQVLSSLGVIILLFEIGLETKLTEMMAVGLKSFLVAVVGVVVPACLGYVASSILMPDLSQVSKFFMAAIMTATSVGISARVFKDLKFTQAPEARIVLGAAVIDDILGLILLAIASGIAQCSSQGTDCTSISPWEIFKISGVAIGFVTLAVALGAVFAKRTIKLLSVFRVPGFMLNLALVLCFIGAYLANQAGLATIVGAFAVGLVLEEVHFKVFKSEREVEDYIRPISLFLVPIFFVLTGMNVDLAVFADPNILFTALIISVLAVAGKLVSGWSFRSTKTPVNRWLIGVGMIPRGEVGLIFATVGKSLGVVDDRLYAITVIMVVLTSLVAPPFLSLIISRSKTISGSDVR